MPSNAQRKRTRKAARRYANITPTERKQAHDLPQVSSKQQNPLVQKHIFELQEFGLSQEICKMLFRGDVDNFAELITKSEKDVLKIKGIGPARLANIKLALSSAGYSLS